ncbi:glycosyltransferase [Bizionia argentinensis JUB59]|uniref:Glycosyltransferase n=1 Tax=Bizionia argentinensis JUB59 TaxID=1046627 RepID=G2EAS3_9FLAO|nr:glycosyltransferase [Bizionia argentinensis]EGV44337.1 glycosyltransferase [Bizionia argentinensis JUB59]
MNNPLVSIIIPCYNDNKHIFEAVLSANTQTYSNKEIIVVDDGSNGATKVALGKLSFKIDKIITQENKGLSSARNTGIRAAKGSLIIVLDSDDFFEPEFCESAVGIKLQNPHYKIISCKARRFDANGLIDIYTPRGGDIKNFLFSNSAIGNSLFSKADWEHVGGYDEYMKKGYEDWEFYIRMLLTSGEAFIIQEPLFNYRQKKNSLRISANSIKYELWQYIYTKHEKLYKANYPLMIKFFLEKLRHIEKEKLKQVKRIDFKIGKFILSPFRFFKRKFR